ncbi:cytokine receptor common subunit beta [Lampris incognitus]|uniref:cytokine receptor common subunit beta n=1 Tax=Lampris incognitus TaxID=2546036 RepID=UPI0024B57C46|nr:cytokine receptor common subunit beta [Lampris incognitus]
MTVQCRYRTRLFASTISHTFFFKTKNISSCSSVPYKSSEALSQLLKVHPPVELSTHAAAQGGQLLQWSSPYPTFSSWSKIHLTYQLNYRRVGQVPWTIENLRGTNFTLEAESLLVCCWYEARVRARGKIGQWSEWSPLVKWPSAQPPRQVPSLQCVLDGENEVTCHWEMSTDLVNFITYQLVCRQNQTAPSEKCCVNSSVSADSTRAVLRYSCSLTVPDPEHLLLELIPRHRVKAFKAHQHIRPKCPGQVTVTERGEDWVVKWEKPSQESQLQLRYQVSYWNAQNQEDIHFKDVQEGSMSLTVQDVSLAPSQRYKVKVRTLLVPGEGPRYEGSPSEWTKPVDWTSRPAKWTFSTFLYVFLSVIVTIAFFALYCTVPACQRKVARWVASVPSPDKSNVFSELKCPGNSWTLMLREDTYICKVQNLESSLKCYSEALLLHLKDPENKMPPVSADGGCWDCEELPSTVDKETCTETTAWSFSGPYIFCKMISEPDQKSADIQGEKEKEDTVSDGSPPLPPNQFVMSLPGSNVGHVPNCSPSRSTEEAVSHSNDNGTTTGHDGSNLGNQDADVTQTSPTKPSITCSTTGQFGNHSAYVRGEFLPWHQGGALQPSAH